MDLCFVQGPQINLSAPITINTGLAGMVVHFRMELPFLAWLVAKARASHLNITSGVLPDSFGALARIIRAETGIGIRKARRAVEEADGLFLFSRRGRTAIRSDKYITEVLVDCMEDEASDTDCRKYLSFIRNLLYIRRDARALISGKLSQIRAVFSNMYAVAGSASFISRKTTAESLKYSRRHLINCAKKEDSFITKETGVAFEPHEIFKGGKIEARVLSQALMDAEKYARDSGVYIHGNGRLLKPTVKKGKCLIACQIGNRYGYSDNTTVRSAGWLAQHLWRRQNMTLPHGSANSSALHKNRSGVSQLALRTVPAKLATFVNEILKRIVEGSSGKLLEWTGAKFISLSNINFRLITLSLPFEDQRQIDII